VQNYFTPAIHISMTFQELCLIPGLFQFFGLGHPSSLVVPAEWNITAAVESMQLSISW